MVHKLYYGHFFCHVFHQDYIVRKGVDPLAMEHRIGRCWMSAAPNTRPSITLATCM
ncbi:hypothetical protein ULG90_13270 [Halopseudomonas pachastrellae]|nr:hypothetical protein ULG90_13270 [Halopseudomonas pachastrellae]